MHTYKKLLIESVGEICNFSFPTAERIDLMMSGGCDSTALFFCLLEIRRPFVCHTYFLDEHEKHNLDLASTRHLTQKHGIKLFEYKLSTPDYLKNIQELKSRFGFTGKVNLQCLAAHYPIVEKNAKRVFLNGSYADALFGVYKSIFLNCRVEILSEFTAKRLECLNKPNADAVDYLNILMKSNNNMVFYPFSSRPLQDYMLGLTFAQLNKPKQKQLFYDAFAEYGIDKKLVARRAQQIASGIRDRLKGVDVKYK